MKCIALASIAALVGAAASAAPVTYILDPNPALKRTTWAVCRSGAVSSRQPPAK
jgi:hypothetical protein